MRGGMRRPNRLLMMIPVFVTVLCGQTPQPHAGWKLVPGGENLIGNGYWDQWVSVSAPATVQVSNGVLTATASDGYLGDTNVLAPYLETKGDFGVVATIQTAPGLNGNITLTGSLQTGTQYWQQGEFFVFFNGVQYGPFKDPGLFALGAVMPGFSLAPNQEMKLIQLAFEVPLGDASAQLIAPAGVIPYVHPGDSLGSLAAVTGRTFGTTVSTQQLSTGRYTWGSIGVTGGAPDPTFAPKVMGEFNSIVAADMYYFMTETAQGYFTFGTGDAILAGARANGKTVHCHNLVGPNIYLPSWVVNGKFTAAQLTEIMKTHIQTVVGHFKGQCESWDVVNEALGSDGTVTTYQNIWAQTIGPSYIDLAFQTAHQMDPGAKLYYNEYYVENQTPKTTGLYNLVAGMQQRGIPIDGVGLQCHWNASGTGPGSVPSHDSMVANMAQLAKMGLSVRLSELDAKILLPASAADPANQAAVFSTTVQACLDSPNCVSIAVWGADDAVSWIPSTFPGYGAATLFDANFQPKPAYTSVMNTLRTAALAVPTAPKLTSKIGRASC